MIVDAHSLGLDVVAEGIETDDQLGFMRDRQCSQAQGYLLGRPAPADEVTELLKKDRRPKGEKPSKQV
jgi:EAL domain-containing protein (putative c-di-GMP-specific phosphodiesterase class I)